MTTLRLPQLLNYGLFGLPLAMVALPIYVYLPQFYAERALNAAMQIEEAARKQDGALRELSTHTDRVRKTVGS